MLTKPLMGTVETSAQAHTSTSRHTSPEMDGAGVGWGYCGSFRWSEEKAA